MTAPAGTETETVETETGTETGDETTETPGAEALGDAGKKALDAMKASLKTEKAARKAAEDKLAAATKPKADSDKGPDLDALREQIRTETRTETLRDRVLDKIEAKAAGKFRDPEDALLRLGRNLDEFIDGGKIDVEAITEALDELLTKRPDFAVAQRDGKAPKFTGTADGGAKGSAGKPQLTDAQVKQMYKEGKTEEIETARKAGQLNTLLGIKS